MRDTQRERVYQAEFRLRDLFATAERIGNPTVELDGIRLTLPPEARFASVESMQSYCDRVTTMVAASPVRVRERKGDAHAHYAGGEIAVPTFGTRWAMREVVVLHELAHHLAIGERHGPGFVATFNDLLARVMGPEVGLAYRILCTHEGVKEGTSA
ncbi:MAG TPA: TIGR04338 family metallohydrolase [Flavobacteriales bacterium]|jgi:putative metallohydrolase (TIGR04338 family)|nr:TIGR04338 family metallohydrolase [Flavobacteriales bacterium]